LINLFTEIQREKISLLYFLIEGTNNIDDIERSMTSNLALGLFAQVFINSNLNFFEHIIVAIKKVFALNKKLYTKKLKNFTNLHSKSLSRSLNQNQSISNLSIKENQTKFSIQTPRKTNKEIWNPKSEQLKHCNSLVSEQKPISQENETNFRSAFSQKQINNSSKKSHLNMIFGDNTSISSGSDIHLQSEIRY
jgi:hypothetical protein